MTAFGTYRFGPFVLDTRRWCLERDGEAVALQPKVFKTLLYLVQHPGRVIPKQELFAELWPGTIVTDGVLSRCIKELRQALSDDARESRFIRTAARVGYAFVADVEAGTTAVRDVPLALAALPFRPLAVAERDEALELSMADDLINQLSSVKGLVVRPLSAVRRYAGPDHDPIDAGREQRADVVIEGPVPPGPLRSPRRGGSPGATRRPGPTLRRPAHESLDGSVIVP
jgi:adenylate cyclase